MAKISYDYEQDVLTIQLPNGEDKVIKKAFEKHYKDIFYARLIPLNKKLYDKLKSQGLIKDVAIKTAINFNQKEIKDLAKIIMPRILKELNR